MKAAGSLLGWIAAKKKKSKKEKDGPHLALRALFSPKMDFEFWLFDLRIIQRTDLGLWVGFKFKPSNKNPGVKTNKNSALVLIVCVVLNLQMFNMGYLSRFIIYILNLFKLCPPNSFLRHSMEVRPFPKKSEYGLNF